MKFRLIYIIFLLLMVCSKNIYAYFKQIGTIDQPTIDGKIFRTKQDQQNSFNDEWVQSSQVKNMLLAASKQCKLKYVLDKTNQMNVPAAIALIPMIESNYETKALSTKGAAGSWQLMPSTAKAYGVRNQDRFQFTFATNASIKYLTDLYQQFKNWELAFAAYNAGSNRVSKALKNNVAATTIDELDLPKETKNYVKRIKKLAYQLTQ